ncbi:MAG: flagellar export chaperone FliS [Lachnospiraceae bacterium]|nr:flagellar export chaperone FliS [Lachnospiraceae bacterium]
MAITKNPYQTYNNSRIMTATPAELTLMLYDGAIKFANIAKAGMEEKNYEKANNGVQKVRDIISEFQITLDRKYPVAEDFDKVYSYIKQRLSEANVKKDPEIMEEILGHLRTMRDTWKEVMKLATMAKAN